MRKIPTNNVFFHYYNANPKRRKTGDCVIRAISLGMDKRYKEVLMEMAEMSWQTGYSMGSSQLIDKYLKANGWEKQKQPRHLNNKKVTGRQWLNTCGMKTMIVSIGVQHLSCIKEGQFWDIWDCSGRCMGVYYVKK